MARALGSVNTATQAHAPTPQRPNAPARASSSAARAATQSRLACAPPLGLQLVRAREARTQPQFVVRAPCLGHVARHPPDALWRVLQLVRARHPLTRRDACCADPWHQQAYANGAPEASEVASLARQRQSLGISEAEGKVRVVSRPISPRRESIRFRRAPRTYASWGVRVASLTKSRKIPA